MAEETIMGCYTAALCVCLCVCENIHMWSARCSIEQVKEIRKQSPALTFLSCLVHTWCGPTIITSHGCGTAEDLEVRTWSSQTWFLSGDSTHASLSTDTKNRSESETLRADIQSLTWVQLASFFSFSSTSHLSNQFDRKGVLSACCVQVRQVTLPMCWAVLKIV